MDGLTLAVVILEVVKLAKAGLTDGSAYSSAINKLKATFPEFKRELSASFDAFLQDGRGRSRTGHRHSRTPALPT